MKLLQNMPSLLIAAPVALILMVVGAPASHADNCGNGLSVGVGGKGVCVGPQDNGNAAPATPSPSQTPPAVAPAPEPAAPAPTEPAPLMTPGPVQTAIVEAPVPVPAKVETAPIVAAPVAPPVAEPVTKPTVGTSPEATKTAAAPVPSETPSTETITLQGTADGVHSTIFDFAPWMFFIGLIGLTTMLIVAKKKRMFPFEEPNARAAYAPITATKDAGNMRSS